MGFGYSPDIHVPVTHDDEIVQFYARMPEGMTIPILRGREFSMKEGSGTEAVAIVNESFARQVFGARDPIGHTITIGKTMRIVGVAKDSKYFTLGEKQRLAVYEPYFSHKEPVNLSFIVRAAGASSGRLRFWRR